jgi:hypothetical protein
MQRLLGLVLLLGLVACQPKDGASAQLPAFATSSATFSTSPPAGASAVNAGAPTALVTSPSAVALSNSACQIAMTEDLEAHVYAGQRMTPERRATRDGLDPRTRNMWDGMDHGVTHLLCKYAVRVNGRDYSYEYEGGTNVSLNKPLDTAMCATPVMRDAAVQSVREATENCADLHRGASRGSDLVPRPRVH